LRSIYALRLSWSLLRYELFFPASSVCCDSGDVLNVRSMQLSRSWRTLLDGPFLGSLGGLSNSEVELQIEVCLKRNFHQGLAGWMRMPLTSSLTTSQIGSVMPQQLLNEEEDLFRREGLKIAAAHLAREDPIPTATTQLVRALAEEGVTSFEDKLGRRWNLDTYAEMVVRTTTSEAIFQGTQTQMLARGFDLVQVNQVVGACPQCIPFENKVFSLTGRADGFPRLKITFPIHPQCRHFIFPAPEAVEERRQALGVVA
jgi:hypothetical protein